MLFGIYLKNSLVEGGINLIKMVLLQINTFSEL
jgi:hypothetical protein